MLTLVKHPLVDCDLEEAALWYHQRNPIAAERLIDDVRDAMRTLAESPARFSVRFGNVRRLKLHRFPYNIYFSFANSEVYVWAIVHGARDLENLIKGRFPPAP